MTRHCSYATNTLRSSTSFGPVLGWMELFPIAFRAKTYTVVGKYLTMYRAVRLLHAQTRCFKRITYQGGSYVSGTTAFAQVELFAVSRVPTVC